MQPDLRVIGEAADGSEAVRLARLHRPNVLNTDIAMAGLDGIEATRQVRDSCSSMQAVVLSMDTSLEYVVRAVQAGALGYVLKESASADVIAAVRAAHAGQVYLGHKIATAHKAIVARPGVSRLQSLSAREREVLYLVVEGQTSAQIAVELGLSPKTVGTYRSRLMYKVGIDNLPSLVRFAIQIGVLALE